MNRQNTDEIARACRTLGLKPETFKTVDALKQAVIAKGQNGSGHLGLAELIAARLATLPADRALGN